MSAFGPKRHMSAFAQSRARQVALRLRQASAAVAATMGKAKILGLIIDRREVGDVGAFDHLTDEQLVEEAAKRALLALPVCDWSTRSRIRPGQQGD
jgi:hypothetical protein